MGNLPIFIVGSGRSGTTLLLRLLCEHPDVAWVSTYTDRSPAWIQLALLSRIWDLPEKVRRQASRLSYVPRPSIESLGTYEYCQIRALSESKRRPLIESDVTPEATLRLQRAVVGHMRYQGKKRFVNKNTNNSMRIRFLKAIFPDAFFVHAVRDGRAVVHSLLNVYWWPDLRLWWCGTTAREWEASGKEVAELAAQHYHRQVREVLDAKPSLRDNQYFEVRYEDLTKDPASKLQELAQFCDIEYESKWEERIRTYRLTDRDYKWRRNLTTAQKAAVTRILRDDLELFGYPVT